MSSSSTYRVFLEEAEWTQLAALYGTPTYLYDAPTLRAQAAALQAFPAPYGLTARFAMKAAPNAAILRLLHEAGLHFDASSGHEAWRAMRAGVPGDQISLSAQELPEDFPALVRAGVQINACSLHQVQRYAAAFPGTAVGLRFNPGTGSGHSGKTNVGGRSSSFGIWHEKLPEAAKLAAAADLTVNRIHTHIGSGVDPAVWQRVAELTLAVADAFPTVTAINLGGGFKVGRVPTDKATDLQVVGAPVAAALEAFAARTGRRLRLELEPGTFLVANAGALLSRVMDVVDTGPEGYRFLKLDTGMTEILRPSLYAAQHPVDVHPRRPGPTQPYVVVGHCCESGDLLTPAPGEAESLGPRALPPVEIGDLVLLGATGAYCAAMAATNYNSFPAAPEVLREGPGRYRLIRRRQTLDDVVAAEV